MSDLSTQFADIADNRASDSPYSLSNTPKSLSLLNFQERTRMEDGNLLRVYGIQTIPSDVQMRTILTRFLSIRCAIASRRSSHILRVQRFWIPMAIKLQTRRRLFPLTGRTLFFDQGSLLLLHREEVSRREHELPPCCLSSGDCLSRQSVGICACRRANHLCRMRSVKNYCERNAAKRLVEMLRLHYAERVLLFVEYALFANAPHIRQIRSASPDCHYLLAIWLFGLTKCKRRLMSCLRG